MIQPAPRAKRSPGSTAAAIVLFSCFGGFQIGLGFHDWISARFEYHWIGEFLIGAAFVCYGAYWAVQLVRDVAHAKLRTQDISQTVPQSDKPS